MRQRDVALAHQLGGGLSLHEKRRKMPGIASNAARECLLEQLVESVRRVRYPAIIQARGIGAVRADPGTEAFDPLKAAMFHQAQGSTDEAFWLVFLFVHFGKHGKSGYRLARDVYAGDGSGQRWTWARTSAHPKDFDVWIKAQATGWQEDGVRRGFGAHRRYESVAGTGEIVRSYVAWIAPPRSHVEVVDAALQSVAGDRKKAFDVLYRSMGSAVHRFGRLALLDYLAMLGKLGLADIEPMCAYVGEGTGPLRGARLLYRGSTEDKTSDADLDTWLMELGQDLQVGQQEIEDSICNWQKSPEKFKAFRS